LRASVVTQEAPARPAGDAEQGLWCGGRSLAWVLSPLDRYTDGDYQTNQCVSSVHAPNQPPRGGPSGSVMRSSDRMKSKTIVKTWSAPRATTICSGQWRLGYLVDLMALSAGRRETVPPCKIRLNQQIGLVNLFFAQAISPKSGQMRHWALDHGVASICRDLDGVRQLVFPCGRGLGCTCGSKRKRFKRGRPG
jgi:hypothetical protein